MDERRTPSVKAKTLTSKPSMHSSTTTRSPAAPKDRLSMQRPSASSAWAESLHTATPLPGRQAVGLHNHRPRVPGQEVLRLPMVVEDLEVRRGDPAVGH